MHSMELLRPGKPRPMKERTAPRALSPRKAIQWLGKRAPMAAAFFLLSLVQCLSVPSPYAVCCLMVVISFTLPWQGAVLGLGLGLVFRLVWGLSPDVGQFAACALCFLAARVAEGEKRRLYILTAALLALRSVPDWITAEDVQTLLLSGVGIVLGLVSLPALRRCALLIKSRKTEWSEDDLLCLLLPGMLLIAGAARLSAFQMNMGYTLSVLAVLMLSWIAGGAAGICGGLGCGLALLLGGQSALLLVVLTFGALLAGLFQGKFRLLPVGVYLLSSITLTYLTVFSFQPSVVYPGVAGGLIFAFIPGKWMRLAAAWVRSIRWSQPRENAYTRLKMQRWVRAIDRMAEALPHPRMDAPTMEEESESLTEALCANCERLPICWHEQYEQTKQGMHALADRGDDPEDYLRIINRYFSTCPRISRIPPLLNRLDVQRQQRHHRALCADYERDMLQTHLTALSQAAQRISLEGLEKDGEESYWISQADEAIEALRFPGQTAFVKKIDGRMMVCVKCEPLSLRPVAGMNLARQIGTYLGVKLEVTERQSNRIILEERPPLAIVTGMATACAVTLDRQRQPGQAPDNGDAVLVETLSGGKMVLALSDGMGHGAGAQDESKKTLEMLSLCMEAGYTRTQAMTAVNGAMLSATGGEKFATVDLCLIDLWTGEAAMNKLGACASVLVQGQKISQIEGEALPLGIIEHVVPMEHHFTLGEGDLLLMMSDGITDAFPSEEDILSIIRQNRNGTPQHMADALLQEAVLQKDGLPPDDMTVLCAWVRERDKE
ncbi:MAG: SpoIIE family protein phosphatase [Clostridia bacterium]|nr:SpoIIE family protein phosphatase [Clostridia bacterium]